MTTRELDILFLALARDCQDPLLEALDALTLLSSTGFSVRLVVGENGSIDRTREILDWSARQPGSLVQVVDTSAMASGSTRLHRMALGRQILVEEARKFSSRAVAVVDLDEPYLPSVTALTLRAVLDRLDDDAGIFAVAATSRPTYYDLLAFEDDARSYGGLEQRIAARKRNPLTYYRLFRDFIYPEQDRLTSAQEIRCRSAFNGLAIYRGDAYRRGSYTASGEIATLCEHVTFNRSVARATGCDMVIDPAVVLPMPVEHGRRNAPRFVAQRARKLLLGDR
jgi:hypothetical protein